MRAAPTTARHQPHSGAVAMQAPHDFWALSLIHGLDTPWLPKIQLIHCNSINMIPDYLQYNWQTAIQSTYLGYL